MIVGAVVAVAAIAVVLVIALSSGGSKSPTTAQAPPAAPATTAAGTSTPQSPGVTRVAVLNGTSTVGLARRLAGDLQQSGYSRATFLTARPLGAHTVTTVEYAAGHRADASAVARSLGVTSVQPLSPSIRALAGSSTVVVIAGTDKATGAAATSTTPGATATTPGAAGSAPSGQ